ncbi:glycosyltransferase family 39 protein [bacterium]|nr:glycosyltransferase family 39 protein [bacterium]
MIEFLKKKPDLFTFLGLLILFYIIFIHNIWAYPLMDADETRYVSMARDMFNNKDFLTLYLNGEYFFEKPPLFFWLESLSFATFGKINEFTARFPVALLGIGCCYLVYFTGKKIISRSYGVISSLILATSIEFCMLAKLAILDIVVSFCIAFSLSFGLATFFCRESRKKYYWWLFYIYSAFAVLAKGIPGVVIPFGSIFFIALVSKNIKELFKPIYLLPGVILFLLITLPWHIIMFKLHNPLFWNEYIIKHHLSRFVGSEEINRTQPFYFYFITLLWGFLPWFLSCVSVWVLKIKNIFKNLNLQSNQNRFLLYNFIIVIFTLLFFSLSETKLITYILPLYPALACLGGYVWWKYITESKNEKIINFTNFLLGGILTKVSIVAIFAPIFIPKELLNDVGSTRIICLLISFICGAGLILFTKRKFYIGTFASLVLFMALQSAIITEKFFQIDYKMGQYDLMDFAKIAEEKDVSLTTFKFGTKYSLLFYGNMPVTYGPQIGITDLKEALNKKDNFVIIKNKDLKEYNKIDFVIIKQGKKYSLIDKRN